MSRKNRKTNEPVDQIESTTPNTDSIIEDQVKESTPPPFFVGTEPEEKPEYELVVDLGEKKDEVMQVPFGSEGKPFVSTKQDMKNPTDPFIVERYEINRIIRKYVDTMQKVIRDPDKTMAEVTPHLFDLMIKEYGYLHSFLETSHNFIRLRAEQLGSQNYVTAE